MDNRDNIMSQAVRLFSRHGYDAVGIQQICEAAGVSKPTLYHYFGSKRGLIEAVLAEYGKPLVEAVGRAARFQGDIILAVTRVVETLFAFAEEQPGFYRMMLSMWFAPADSEYSRAVGELLHRQHLLLETMFAEAVQNHGNMRGRQRHYAASLRGTVDTYIGLKLQGLAELDSRDMVQRIVHQYLHGVFS